MSCEAVIGLEVHVELSTNTKLFCSCKNEFGGKPNSRICPVCTGQPGTLPVTNKKAIFLALRAALALGCKINKRTEQCRKHYFYPDLPKGYQISQCENPIGIDGEFEFINGDKIEKTGIRQVHIEEDAGKLVHRKDGKTAIDYNRAGVPLIEIVTEPHLHSAKAARSFLESLRRELIRAGISECRMERGSMRCDVNVSLKKKGENVLNNRVEMKNINTFAGAERAIEFEIARQTEIIKSGETVSSETRRWDDEKRTSSLMRDKETAVEYKFMPEPDIPSYIIDDEFIKSAALDLPESDVIRAERYREKKVAKDDIVRLIGDVGMCDFFEGCIRLCADAEISAKLIVGDIAALCSREGVSIGQTKLKCEDVALVSGLIAENKLNYISAKKVLEILIKDGDNAKKLCGKFICITDEEEILQNVMCILSENERAQNDFFSGKEASFTYLMGQCMKRMSGRADANALCLILKKELARRKGERDKYEV